MKASNFLLKRPCCHTLGLCVIVNEQRRSANVLPRRQTNLSATAMAKSGLFGTGNATNNAKPPLCVNCYACVCVPGHVAQTHPAWASVPRSSSKGVTCCRSARASLTAFAGRLLGALLASVAIANRQPKKSTPYMAYMFHEPSHTASLRRLRLQQLGLW